MSSSPESKTTSQTPSVAGSTSAAPASMASPAQVAQPLQPTKEQASIKPTPTTVATPTSAKPATQPVAAAPLATKTPTSATSTAKFTSTSAGSQSNVQFKTANIGKWAAQQENPFAEQNRRADEKRQRSAKTRRKVLPIVAIIGGIIALGLIVWGVVMLVMALNAPEKLPEDIAFGSEGASEVQGKAQEIWDRYWNNIASGDDDQNQDNENPGDTADVSQAIEAVSDYFDEQLSIANNDSQKNDLVIIEMDLMNTNEQPEGVISAGNKGNPDTMTDYQKGLYYGMLTNAYYSVGNISEGDRYFELLTQLPSDDII